MAAVAEVLAVSVKSLGAGTKRLTASEPPDHISCFGVSPERPIVTPEEAAAKVTRGQIALNQEQK